MQISNFTKIHCVGVALFLPDGWMDGWMDGWTDGRTDGRTDGQTDVTKLTVAFLNFAHAPKTIMLYPESLRAQTK
jgi:hypothetical protein